MENVAIRLVFDRKKESTKEKPGLIQIEIKINKTTTKKYISTGVKIFKNQFSLKNGVFVCKEHPNGLLMTANVRKAVKKVTDFVYSDKCISLNDLKYIDEPEIQNHSFLHLFEEEMRIKSSSITFGTLRIYKTLLSNIIEFGKLNLLSDLTYTNIVDFDTYLRSFKIKDTTIHKRHSILKSIINELIKKDILTINPYNKFKIVRGRHKEPTFLTKEEVQKIIEWEPKSNRMEKVKDLFLFQAFTGMAYIDMKNFDKSQLDKIADRYNIIRTNRKKTDERFVIPILNEASMILDKYNNKLPIISYQKYNDYIKVMAEYCQINKHLTTHVGRHTFAMYLFNSGVPIETIAVALGHTKIETTQIYAKTITKNCCRKYIR